MHRALHPRAQPRPPSRSRPGRVPRMAPLTPVARVPLRRRRKVARASGRRYLLSTTQVHRFHLHEPVRDRTSTRHTTRTPARPRSYLKPPTTTPAHPARPPWTPLHSLEGRQAQTTTTRATTHSDKAMTSSTTMARRLRTHTTITIAPRLRPLTIITSWPPCTRTMGATTTMT